MLKAGCSSRAYRAAIRTSPHLARMPESATCLTRRRHNAECADLGLCRRRSWAPRRSGARGQRGRHNPIGGNAGVRNRTEASRVDLRSNARLAGRRNFIRARAFTSSRRRESVAASKPCASNGAEAQECSRAPWTGLCRDREWESPAAQVMPCQGRHNHKVGTIGDREGHVHDNDGRAHRRRTARLPCR
jgi:hypothetical protein